MRARKKIRERGEQVQSLTRAIAIINRLAEADEGTTLTDLAQQVGLSTSTAHRLLTTLEEERFVHFDAGRRLWSVGVQAFTAGAAFLRTRNVVATARPHMQALMTQAGETVNLAVEDQGEAVYLAQVECREMMRAFATPGVRVPLHCSSVGKALLAVLSDSELSKTLHQQGLIRLTQKTISTPTVLRQDLAHARRRGFALDDEEHAVGLRCVGSVIFDEFGGALGAISISGPAVRMTDERMPILGELVRCAADAVTKELGGRLPLWRSR